MESSRRQFWFLKLYYWDGVGLNPIKPLSEGWLVPQLGHPGVQPDKHWQEFFMEKVMNLIDENGHIDLPLFTWISDKNDLTKSAKDM